MGETFLKAEELTRLAREAGGVPLLMRIDDVSELLRVPRRSLQRLRSRGEFPKETTKIGRFPVWNRNLIMKFANGEWKPGRKAAAGG
jgi:hypothetical protein